MKVAVIGAGVMGPGIAQVFLMGGHQVCLTDVRQEALDTGEQEIRSCLTLMERMGVAQGALTCLDSLTRTTTLADAVAGADLVVEAIPERFDLKQALYGELDQLCGQETVIVSNTSAFPLPDMMPGFRPQRFFVAHFFNPPAIIPLVELVKNDRTDPDIVLWLRRLLEDCGKKPIVLNRFVNGFLINRMQTAMAREALSLLEQGVVSPEDLDTASIVGIGFKTAWQGFFDTMDHIGLDTVAAVYQLLYPDLCNATQVPEVVLDKVRQGHLGVKTGEGFLRYDGDPATVERRRFTVLLEQLKLYTHYREESRVQWEPAHTAEADETVDERVRIRTREEYADSTGQA